MLGLENVLVKPLLTEKTSKETEAYNRYAFVVQRTADRVDVVDGGLWQEDHADHFILLAGQPAEALVEFDLALKTSPNRAQAMLGRVRALQQVGDQPGTVKAAADLLLVWRHADASLGELSTLRNIR